MKSFLRDHSKQEWVKVLLTCDSQIIHPGNQYFLGPCNNFETVFDFARSELKLVLLDSHKTYHI